MNPKDCNKTAFITNAKQITNITHNLDLGSLYKSMFFCKKSCSEFNSLLLKIQNILTGYDIKWKMP